MKVSHALLMVLSLTALISVQFLPQVVHATSETFPLTLYTPIVRNVELQKNDRLVGEFTITNIPKWTNVWGQQEYSCLVMIIDPIGQILLMYTRTKSDSFNFTASSSGVYRIQFQVESDFLPPSGLGNPLASINYDVVSPSSPSLRIDPIFLAAIIVAATLIPIGSALAIVFSRRKSRPILPQPPPPPPPSA
jgi:hypothetical protein